MSGSRTNPDLPRNNVRPNFATLILLLLLIVIAGCATTSRKAAIAWRTHLQLCAPSALALPAYALHEVTMAYQGNSLRFLGQMEFDGTNCVLAASSMSGMRLFVVTDDGQQITYAPHPLFTAPLRAKFVLADFAIMFAPLAVLRESGVDVRQTNAETRTVYRDSKPVVTVRYDRPDQLWNSEVRYGNISRHYTILLKPISTAMGSVASP